MQLHHVHSEGISAIGYDSRLKTLVVRFRHGGLYAYRGVPRHVFDAMRNAPSLGGYFMRHVRDRFDHVKLNEPAGRRA